MKLELSCQNIKFKSTNSHFEHEIQILLIIQHKFCFLNKQLTVVLFGGQVWAPKRDCQNSRFIFGRNSHSLYLSGRVPPPPSSPYHPTSYSVPSCLLVFSISVLSFRCYGPARYLGCFTSQFFTCIIIYNYSTMCGGKEHSATLTILWQQGISAWQWGDQKFSSVYVWRHFWLVPKPGSESCCKPFLFYFQFLFQFWFAVIFRRYSTELNRCCFPCLGSTHSSRPFQQQEGLF